MDMRNVGAVYFIYEGELIKATLNDRIAGNADYADLTMKQYEEFMMLKKRMNAEGKIHNEELTSYTHTVNSSIVENIIHNERTIANDKEMRLARENEKQIVSSKNRIETRFDENLLITKQEELPPQELVNLKETEVESKDWINLTQEELLEKQRQAFQDFFKSEWEDDE